jgi:thiol-disulfide isomerase/thioredoxin
MTERSFVRRRVALLATILAFCGTLRAIDSRASAPRFVAKTMDGEKFTNDVLKGKVVLLQFWTTWCSNCRHDQEAVEAVVQEFASQSLVVLAVDVGESKKKVKQYLEASPRSCKIVLTEDTNLAAVFAAKSYPLYVLLDRDGKITGTQNGAAGEDALFRLLSKAGLERK